MNVLGFSAFDYDSSAALIIDGKVEAIAQEKHFTKKSHDSSIPIRAIRYCISCLSRFNSNERLDYVVFYKNPFLLLEGYLNDICMMNEDLDNLLNYDFKSILGEQLWVHEKISELLPKLGKRAEFMVAEPDLSYAAAAFYLSPFSDAVVITVDGIGDETKVSIGVGYKNQVDLKKEIKNSGCTNLSELAKREYIEKVIRYAKKDYGSNIDNLVLAGDVPVESDENAYVSCNGSFGHLWIHHAARGVSESIGAALYLYHHALQNPRYVDDANNLKKNLLEFPFSNEDIQSTPFAKRTETKKLSMNPAEHMLLRREIDTIHTWAIENQRKSLEENPKQETVFNNANDCGVRKYGWASMMDLRKKLEELWKHDSKKRTLALTCAIATYKLNSDLPIRNMVLEKKTEEYSKLLRSYAAKIGSIVMNCNPFTNGHRYIIEQASKRVSHLYIFVVQEDRSFFSFSDRFELVKQGTKDLTNVTVIPSGKSIISSLTFPDYFNKENVQNQKVDTANDVVIFAKEIAPVLSINMRFAGTEPYDKITKQYNEKMRQILPQYGIDFVEIPRCQWDGSAISAKKVRELFMKECFNQLINYVPFSTLAYLWENRDRYFAVPAIDNEKREVYIVSEKVAVVTEREATDSMRLIRLFEDGAEAVYLVDENKHFLGKAVYRPVRRFEKNVENDWNFTFDSLTPIQSDLPISSENVATLQKESLEILAKYPDLQELPIVDQNGIIVGRATSKMLSGKQVAADINFDIDSPVTKFYVSSLTNPLIAKFLCEFSNIMVEALDATNYQTVFAGEANGILIYDADIFPECPKINIKQLYRYLHESSFDNMNLSRK